MTSRRAVFLGREGVLDDDRRLVRRPDDFRWLPGAMPALKWLQRAGWHLVLVSNQPGIAQGLFGPAEYDNLTGWMQAELAAHDVTLDAVYHCPHLPDAPLAAWRRQCECHLPKPGMLRRAARELHLDLSSSVMVGHDASEIAAGRAAGLAACIRVDAEPFEIPVDPAQGPPRPGLAPAPLELEADFTCASLADAAYWLLSHERELRA